MWEEVVEEINNAAHEEDPTRILEALKAYIDENYKRPVNVYSRARRLAKQLGGEEFMKRVAAVLKQTKEEYKSTIAEQRKAVEARNEKVVSISEKRYRKVLSSCYDSCDYIDWIIAAQLACGARLREILDPTTSQFHTVLNGKDKEEYCVEQRGVAKSKGGTKILRKKLIGLYVDAFTSLVADVRAQIAEEPLSMSAITSRVNRYTKHYFSLEGKMKRGGSHTNRALYAALMRKQAEATTSGPRAVQLALGHDTMHTAPHYMHVRITDDESDDEEAQQLLRRYSSEEGGEGQARQRMLDIRKALLDLHPLVPPYPCGILDKKKISPRMVRLYRTWEKDNVPEDAWIFKESH